MRGKREPNRKPLDMAAFHRRPASTELLLGRPWQSCFSCATDPPKWTRRCAVDGRIEQEQWICTRKSSNALPANSLDACGTTFKHPCHRKYSPITFCVGLNPASTKNGKDITATTSGRRNVSVPCKNGNALYPKNVM